jgi:hypothetical protein
MAFLPWMIYFAYSSIKNILMKRFFSAALLLTGFFVGQTACAQDDKSKRPSPPAIVKQTLPSGATVSIDYSQPSVKGRTIGKDLEPMEGQVWRTGANEATIFETDKDLTIDGKTLPAGKYALFSISGKEKWTIIFNKTWKQWGAYDYKQSDDALRISATVQKAGTVAEKLSFVIDLNGGVSLKWGEYVVSFTIK